MSKLARDMSVGFRTCHDSKSWKEIRKRPTIELIQRSVTMNYKTAWLRKKMSKGIQTPCTLQYPPMVKQHVYFKAAVGRQRASCKDAVHQGVFSVGLLEGCLESRRSKIVNPIKRPSNPRTFCHLT